jgi:hypothetical protein
MPHVKSHEVFATKIVGVLPLTNQNGQLISPEAGLVLLLEDRSRHRWLTEQGGVTPTIGDFLVEDRELLAAFIVSAVKFAELFEVVE